MEIQQTFYQPPRRATAERWRRHAPAEFEFTLKAWQVITHAATSPTYRRLRAPLPGPPTTCGGFQPTDAVETAWEATAAMAEALAAPIIVFQCPASFAPTRDNQANLRRFFRAQARARWRGTYVWEPRGAWEPDLVRRLCDALGLVHGVDPFGAEPTTRGLRYFRLHGIGGFRYRFTDEDLRGLAHRVRSGPPAYVLFNNVSMYEDATRFARFLAGPGTR